ncbi:MAG TPA: deoxynucleoside kinase [Deinococcales bacterium]|nr:deoxynucleoside kinase [Deinococcales bacterium]
MYVAVAGNIGSGKSSLTRLVAERYGLNPVFEAVDENPYLEDFYERMDLYGFHSQIFFLARRLKQHLAQVNPGRHVVQDRTVYEDAAVFATNLHRQGIMSDRDFGSYWQLYEAVTEALRAPDLLVYLRADLPKLRRQIERRGRGYESAISDSYLLQLQELYEEWVSGYDASRLLVIESSSLDFVHNGTDRRHVFSLLEQHGLPAPLL